LTLALPTESELPDSGGTIQLGRLPAVDEPGNSHRYSWNQNRDPLAVLAGGAKASYNSGGPLLFRLIPYFGGLGLLGAAAWACHRFWRAIHASSLAGHRYAEQRLQSPRQWVTVPSPPPNTMTLTITPFAPLRVLGDAVKERLTVLSASTCASSRRSDDEGLYREARHSAEETQGLLQDGYRSEDEEHFWAPCPPHRREEVTGGDEDGEDAAINALMKLRPSAWDSLGDDETDTDEGSLRPLMGTARAGMLSR